MADPESNIKMLTGRKPGYLACIDNLPPLIFRFQINPEIMTEKRSFKWDQQNTFGPWEFDKPGSISAGLIGAGVALGGFVAAAAAPSGGLAAFGPLAGLTSAMDKIKNFGAALVKTRPLKAGEGEPRTFAIDFSLDARLADVLDEGDHFGGSIAPDLFILRSFVNPSLDMISFVKWATDGFALGKMPDHPPPLCSLFMVGLSVTCVMTDLQIKVTHYGDNGNPIRADVSVTLREQTLSTGPIIEFFQRNIVVTRSLFQRKNFGTDVMNVTPILNLFS